MKISVVIPSYNSEKTIVPCLSSLMDQDLEEPFEVIVVDSSDDATPDIIRERFPDVELIHLDRKTEPGSARNEGIQGSMGDIIAFLDSDCSVRRDWLRKLRDRLSLGYAAVGGSIENANLLSLVAWAGYICEFTPWLPSKRSRLVAHIPTANVAYRREAFAKYGLFPSDMYPSEDFVFNSRLYEHREQIFFDPEIRVVHNHRTGVRSFLRHQIRRGRGAAQIRRVVHSTDSFIIHPLWMPVTVPLLAATKFVVNIYRLLRWRPGMLFFLPLILPPYLLGLLFWTVGFVDGGLYSIKTE